MRFRNALRIATAFITLGAMFVAGRSFFSIGASSSSDRGFIETTFTDRKGIEHHFLVFLPYDYSPNDNRPLILYLNGAGENGSDGYWTIENNFGIQIWETKQAFPFVCAIPQCPVGKQWTGEQLQIAMEFSEWVANRYHTDPDRLIVMGVSSGGTGVWNAVNEYSHRFAAAVPLCGFPDIECNDIAKEHLPIWNIYNRGDDPRLVEANRMVKQRLFECGASPICLELPQEGHDCWTRGLRSIGLYEWLLSQRKSPGRTQDESFEFLSNDSLDEHWNATADCKWSATEEGYITDFPDPDCTDSALVYAIPVAEFDFHVEARVTPEQRICRLAILDESQPSHRFEVSLPVIEDGPAFVYEFPDGMVHKVDVSAQSQLSVDYDNDIRLDCRDGMCNLRINGWAAANFPLNRKKPTSASRWRPALLGGDAVQWKNFRIRHDSNER